MMEFLLELTKFQWVMLWLIGWFLAYISTALKDGPEGLIGSILYVLFSLFIVGVGGAIKLFIDLAANL